MEEAIRFIVIGIVVVVIAVCVAFYEKDKAVKAHEIQMIQMQPTTTN